MTYPEYESYRPTDEAWIAYIPSHWSVTAFRRCCTIQEGQVDPTSDDQMDSFLIAPNHIEAHTGRLMELERTSTQSAISGKYQCRAGDVVYSKIRPSLNKVCITPIDCLCSADMYAIRARPGMTNEFTFWWLLSSPVVDQIVFASERVAMPKVNRDALNEIPVIVPPFDEQRSIAAFLERETAKIDALVAEQERLITLLREKRRAVVSHAVTKGLNPHAPMKGSGVEWLGYVPAHWKMQRLTEISSFIPGKAHEPYLDDDGPFVYVSSRFVSTSGASRKFCTQNLTPACFGDSLLVMSDLPNGRALAKCFFVADDSPYAVNQRVCILRPTGVVPKYLAYLVDRTPELLQHDDGMNQTHLSNADILKPRFPIPPHAEQLRTVEFLDAQLSTIDQLVEQANILNQVVLERRSALITAAVTGQLDVRHLATADAT